MIIHVGLICFNIIQNIILYVGVDGSTLSIWSWIQNSSNKDKHHWIANIFASSQIVEVSRHNKYVVHFLFVDVYNVWLRLLAIGFCVLPKVSGSRITTLFTKFLCIVQSPWLWLWPPSVVTSEFVSDLRVLLCYQQPAALHIGWEC